MNAIDFLLWLQSLRNPVFDLAFSAITLLGSEDFLLAFLALIYWCVNRTLGLRLGLVFLSSQYLNEALKDLTGVPRPFESSQALLPVSRDTTLGTSSWPSGHAQNTAALWGTLAGLVRRRWITVLAVAVIGLVGFSRLYLGLHWPLDVVSGWAIGTAVALVALLVVARFPRVTVQTVAGPWLGGALLAPFVLLALHPTDATAKIMGAGLGLLGGWWLERQFVGFEAPAPLVTQVLKAVIGLVIAFGLRIVLKPVFDVFPGGLAGDLLRYLLIGLWVAVGAPAVFVRVFGRAPTPARVISGPGPAAG